jgi:hypothetical protein
VKCHPEQKPGGSLEQQRITFVVTEDVILGLDSEKAKLIEDEVFLMRRL